MIASDLVGSAVVVGGWGFSWLLTAASLFTSWKVGSGKHWAWLLSIATSLTFAGYGIVIQQYGLTPGGLAGAAVSLRNYLEWHPAIRAPLLSKPLTKDG